MPIFWEQFAHALARLHTSTIHPRFGWHRDNWLGRRRQINTWDDDGFAVYAKLTSLDSGWPARMRIIQLRQHLAVLAQFDNDWGAGEQIRATLTPFRTSS